MAAGRMITLSGGVGGWVLGRWCMPCAPKTLPAAEGITLGGTAAEGSVQGESDSTSASTITSAFMKTHAGPCRPIGGVTHSAGGGNMQAGIQCVHRRLRTTSPNGMSQGNERKWVGIEFTMAAAISSPIASPASPILARKLRVTQMSQCKNQRAGGGGHRARRRRPSRLPRCTAAPCPWHRAAQRAVNMTQRSNASCTDTVDTHDGRCGQQQVFLTCQCRRSRQ